MKIHRSFGVEAIGKKVKCIAMDEGASHTWADTIGIIDSIDVENSRFTLSIIYSNHNNDDKTTTFPFDRSWGYKFIETEWDE